MTTRDVFDKMMFATAAMLVSLAAGAAPPTPTVPLVPACTPPHDAYPFCNTSLSIEDRITNLLTFIPDAVKPNLLTARGGPHGLQNLSHVGVPPYYW